MTREPIPHLAKARCRAGLLAAAFLTALASAQLPAHADPGSGPHCEPVSEHAIARLFERWNAALATTNAEHVSRLFAPDARLATVDSGEPLIGRDAIRDGLKGFLSRHPQGTVLARTITLGCNGAIDSGRHVYRVTGRRMGTRMLIGGEFHIRYELRDGNWLIAEYRSSAMPQALTEPVGRLVSDRTSRGSQAGLRSTGGS